MRFYHVMKKIFSSPVKALYRVQATGLENLPKKGGLLLCANHTGFSDVIVLSASLDRQIRYMAKKELFRIPVLRRFITGMGAFPVNRGGADVASIRKTISIIEDGGVVGVFPQGTRHPGKNPRNTEVKHGVGLIAYRSGCDVLPVCIKTKANKVKLFRRTQIIVGDVIRHEELGFERGSVKEYKAAAELIFDRICTLGGYESE